MRVFQILIVDDDPDMREVLRLSAETVFYGEVITAGSGNEAIELLKGERVKPFLVLSDLNMPNGSGVDLFHHCREAKLDATFVVCSGRPESHVRSLIPDVKLVLEKPNVFVPLKALIQAELLRLKIAGIPEERHFIGVRLDTILRLGFAGGDLFMRLAEDKYVCVSHKEDEFDPELAKRYLAKNIKYFYLKAADVPVFAAELEKNIRFLQENSAIPGEQQWSMAHESMEAVESLARILGWSADTQRAAMMAIQVSVRAISSRPKLQKFFDLLKANPDRYMQNHIQLVAFVASALAQRLNWGSEITLVKLSLAALVHDLPLAELSYQKVMEIEEAIASGQDLSGPDADKYRGHPEAAAALLESLGETPLGVSQIIREHHERPDGSGFPKHLESPKISPLSALFIVSSVFVDYLWSKEIDADLLKNFSLEFSPTFSRGHFRQVLRELQAPEFL